jgi:hypothetical protein
MTYNLVLSDVEGECSILEQVILKNNQSTAVNVLSKTNDT